MTPTPRADHADALRALIVHALRWADFSAGEGICYGDSRQSPEDFLMAYTDATGDEDWHSIADRLPLAAAPKPSEAREIADHYGYPLSEAGERRLNADLAAPKPAMAQHAFGERQAGDRYVCERCKMEVHAPLGDPEAIDAPCTPAMAGSKEVREAAVDAAMSDLLGRFVFMGRVTHSDLRVAVTAGVDAILALTAEGRAVSEPSEERVERAAKAIWSCQQTFAQLESDPERSWASLPDYAKDYARDQARAALSAETVQ